MIKLKSCSVYCIINISSRCHTETELINLTVSGSYIGRCPHSTIMCGSSSSQMSIVQWKPLPVVLFWSWLPFPRECAVLWKTHYLDASKFWKDMVSRETFTWTKQTLAYIKKACCWCLSDLTLWIQVRFHRCAGQKSAAMLW